MRWLALVVVVATLAGCSQPADGKEKADFDDLGLVATSTTGILRGVVVDPAIRPVEGAAVQLTPGPRSAVSTAAGTFGFDGLEPGTYFLLVSKAGYVPMQSSTEVKAGIEEPPIVNVQLVADAGFVPPYVEQFTFEGYIECSTGFGLTPELYGYDSVCSRPSPTGGTLFPNDRTTYQYALTGYPEWVQDEMVWDSTQAFGTWLNHNFYYAYPEETDGNKDLFVIGPSPLLNTMNATTAREFVEGVDHPDGPQGTALLLQARIFTWAPDSVGVAMTLQQRFTIYTTVFYGYTPTEGWLFSSGEPVPSPPG